MKKTQSSLVSNDFGLPLHPNTTTASQSTSASFFTKPKGPSRSQTSSFVSTSPKSHSSHQIPFKSPKIPSYVEPSPKSNGNFQQAKLLTFGSVPATAKNGKQKVQSKSTVGRKIGEMTRNNEGKETKCSVYDYLLSIKGNLVPKKKNNENQAKSHRSPVQLTKIQKGSFKGFYDNLKIRTEDSESVIDDPQREIRNIFALKKFVHSKTPGAIVMNDYVQYENKENSSRNANGGKEVFAYLKDFRAGERKQYSESFCIKSPSPRETYRVNTSPGNSHGRKKERKLSRFSIGEKMERVIENLKEEDSLKEDSFKGNCGFSEQEPGNRKEEIAQFFGEITKNNGEIEGLLEILNEEKKFTDENLHKILAGYEELTNRIIKALQEHTESCMLKLNTEFSLKMQRIKSYSQALEGFTIDFQQMKEDINRNFYQIVNNMEQEPYRKIMDKYHEKVNNFRSLHDTIKCSHIPRSRLPVYEELSAFKNNLNNVLNDILKEPSFEERRRSRSIEITQAKRDLGSGTKSMEHFEGYLMNRKDKGKVSLNKEEHKSFITIEDSEKSDRNMQLVKNSIQSIRDTIKGLNSTQDTNRKTFISNVFGSGSDEGSLAIFSDLKRTPRLNCELWEPPHNNINEFREDEESTYRRKVAQEKKSSCGWGFTQALGEIEIKENNAGNCNERKTEKLNENDKFLSYLQPMLNKMANNKMK